MVQQRITQINLDKTLTDPPRDRDGAFSPTILQKLARGRLTAGPYPMSQGENNQDHHS